MQEREVTIKAKNIITPIIVFFVLAILIIGFYQTRPLWHGLVFRLVYLNWVTIGLTITIWSLVGFFCYKATEDYRDTKERYFWPCLMLILIWFLYFAFAFDKYGKAVAFSFEPEVMTEMPDTAEVRYVPYEVALTYAKSNQSDPTKMPGDIDPIIIEDEFFWIAPRVPNGFWNYLTRQTDGLLIVDETGEVTFQPQEYKYGEGMGVTDSIWWQLKMKNYGATYPEIFYLQIEDEWIGMAPYITYHFSFPVYVPQWGGVMIFHPDGTIEDLTPQQAQKDYRLEGQRLFPERLARAYSGSWGYRFGGLFNVLFTHREDVEIADLANTDNEMPYFLPTEWGPQWMTATNPAGPSQSIFKIFWFDVRTGYARLNEFTEANTLIGPNVGESFARTGTPGYTWSAYLAIEARPVIHQEKLYWMYSLTSNDYAGIGLTVLLDASNSENVLHFKDRESFENWLVGKGEPDIIPYAATSTPTETPPEFEETDLDPLLEQIKQLPTEELERVIQEGIQELGRRATQ